MYIGKLIGKGATAEVYECEENKVLKLYHTGESSDNLKWEFHKMQDAYRNRIPCPEVFDLVEWNGRMGYTMEKLDGESLYERIFNGIKKVIANEISIDEFELLFLKDVKGTAVALAELHNVKIDSWDKLEDAFKREIRSTDFLTPDEKAKIRELIDRLPKEEVVCHCDPNPFNVMYCEGNYRLIDWVNAGIGNRMYDIAEYVWLITPREEKGIEGIPQDLIDFLWKKNEQIVSTFLCEYERVSGKNVSSYGLYMIPLLVRKLHSNRTRKEKEEIVLDIRKRLQQMR